ncbi:MAG: MFS transporter [bacterium]|nr:MFS transporter [bacterium]
MQKNELPVPGSQPVSWREVVTRRHLLLLLVMCLAIWLHAANTLLAATTLPEAVGDIGGLRLISWAFALYLMGSIVAAAAASAFVARAGLRLAMLVSTLLYTFGCIACAAAPVMPVLLAGRTVQGLGGGALVALVFIAQNRFFPDRLIPRIVACLSLTWTASALSGPLIGGAFATAGLWRFAFWSFALQGLVLAALLYPMLARARSEAPLEARQLPVVRLMFIAGAILAISFAGAASSIAVSAVLLLAGCLCVWLFTVRDAAVSRRFRLLPEHATSLVHPVGCGIAMTFVLSLSMMSLSVYGPILLIRLYGLTSFEAGLVVVTESLGWGAGAFFLSGLAPAYEGRLIRLGSVLLAAGLAAQAWFVPHGPLWFVVTSAFIGNAGFGMIWGYVIKHVVASADRDDRDRASSMLPSTQQAAFAIGAALTGIIANVLGFERISQPGEFQTAALWLFGAFVPPALIGMRIAWRFSCLIAPTRSGVHGQHQATSEGFRSRWLRERRRVRR